MRIDGSTLRLEADDRKTARLTGVALPDARSSGGLLLRDETGPTLILFKREELAPGDELVGADGRRFTVTAVRELTFDGEAVTGLRVRPGPSGRAGPR